jgi:chromate transport protein ChrA
MKNYQIMITNAIILIVLGLFSYLNAAPEHKSMTAFIAPAVGSILLILAIPVKKQSPVGTHVGVGLTGIVFIVFIITGIVRDNVWVIVMAVVTLIALLFYINDFLKRKKEREAAKKSV